MTKTSRFRHRRAKMEQRKLRTGFNPKPVTRADESETPLSKPLIAIDPTEGSIFNGDSVLNKPEVARIELVEGVWWNNLICYGE